MHRFPNRHVTAMVQTKLDILRYEKTKLLLLFSHHWEDSLLWCFFYHLLELRDRNIRSHGYMIMDQVSLC